MAAMVEKSLVGTLLSIKTKKDVKVFFSEINSIAGEIILYVWEEGLVVVL